ncbi:class I SAM-dependent methyltransferase [Roseovarius salinarum]|uniref:hypothetical protein n=1 Tax=Roseovarius salinarum TaxID=1981892 RepID=UPI0012FFD638|nr:hypothetical protein [Roseovarius salinarum]
MKNVKSEEVVEMGKDERIEYLISEGEGRRFLEVGLGPDPKLRRHRLIEKHGYSYIGLDFHDVCEMHQSALRKDGVKLDRHEFIGNDRSGSYLFSLVHLLNRARKSGKFDIIFFDGHHTLNVDAAPLMVCAMLLKDGGALLVDDYRWTLENARSNLEKNEFYDGVYNFDAYTESELNKPHIKIICEQILPEIHEFKIDSELSLPNWKVLWK